MSECLTFEDLYFRVIYGISGNLPVKDMLHIQMENAHLAECEKCRNLLHLAMDEADDRELEDEDYPLENEEFRDWMKTEYDKVSK